MEDYLGRDEIIKICDKAINDGVSAKVFEGLYFTAKSVIPCYLSDIVDKYKAYYEARKILDTAVEILEEIILRQTENRQCGSLYVNVLDLDACLATYMYVNSLYDVNNQKDMNYTSENQLVKNYYTFKKQLDKAIIDSGRLA